MENIDVLWTTKIGNVEVIVVENASRLGRSAGELIAAQIRSKPDTVLGLCTGGTPVPVYNHLIHLYCERRVSFSGVTTFNLDEYYPIKPGDPNSYRHFMDRHLFDFVDIDKRSIFMLSGLTPDPQETSLLYEARIAEAGGIDLMLAGLGHNTHIGFNEPPCGPDTRTRLVELSADTRARNARFFPRPEDVPKFSITMGLGTILESRAIILCAFGPAKAEAVNATLCGPISEMAPGSFIQRHPNAKCILDREAASLLTTD